MKWCIIGGDFAIRRFLFGVGARRRRRFEARAVRRMLQWNDFWFFRPCVWRGLIYLWKFDILHSRLCVIQHSLHILRVPPRTTVVGYYYVIRTAFHATQSVYSDNIVASVRVRTSDEIVWGGPRGLIGYSNFTIIKSMWQFIPQCRSARKSLYILYVTAG